jgi:hypothetical protein
MRITDLVNLGPGSETFGLPAAATKIAQATTPYAVPNLHELDVGDLDGSVRRPPAAAGCKLGPGRPESECGLPGGYNRTGTGAAVGSFPSQKKGKNPSDLWEGKDAGDGW